MGKSNKVCPVCGKKMKQQFIGLQHCKCGMRWKKDIGFFERTNDMVLALELAQESLAGRAALLHMPSLSQHEIYGSKADSPFTVDLNVLKERVKTHKPADMQEIYQRIWNGSMPGLIGGRFSDRDVGVSDDTVKRWLHVLEKSDIIFYLRPYSNNLLKRTVKTPKLYFFDTGLVAYLTKYSSPDILASGALNGAILENYVVAELLKTYHNNAKECLLWYYRDKEMHEIDMVIESDGMLHPLEIKRSVNPGSEPVGAFDILNKGSVPKGKGAILCMRPTLSAVNADNYIVLVWMI